MRASGPLVMNTEGQLQPNASVRDWTLQRRSERRCSQRQGVRLNTGGKPLNGTVFLNDELLKIPANVASMTVSIGRLAKCFVQGETVSTVHIALGHQREGDVEL